MGTSPRVGNDTSGEGSGDAELISDDPQLLARVALLGDDVQLERPLKVVVDAGNGEWYLAHLCGRPVEWLQAPPATPPGRYENLHCPLGRETALQRVTWTDDGWPRLAHHAIRTNSGSANNMRSISSVTASTP